MNIEVGQIWQVCTNEFWTTDDCGGLKLSGRKACVCLNRDEYIEIRYPYEWHFRTADDSYFHAEPISILKNCRYIGKINEKTRFSNRSKLQEILDGKLYTAVWDEDNK